MKAMKEELRALGQKVEERLEMFFTDDTVPDRLAQAMRYSLLAGGKRVRPVLCLAWADIAGGSMDKALDFACALECIHTYSLIHDDLPAMDDDDLRRGNPSNHKQFDEATAILAGDGLLTEAFALAGTCPLPAERLVRAMVLLSDAAGPRGMVGGQMQDMQLTGTELRPEENPLALMQQMHAAKTGALLQVSCDCGAVLGGADAAMENRAKDYGRALGLAFQIADDILDIVGDEALLGKPVGSDEEQGKLTYPALFGLEESRRLAEKSMQESLQALEGLKHPKAEFLRQLARYTVQRTS